MIFAGPDKGGGNFKMHKFFKKKHPDKSGHKNHIPKLFITNQTIQQF